MTTQCNAEKLAFHELDSREVVGRFDGGEITSDAGGILLREVEKRTAILCRMSECFEDHRDRDRIEHTVESLVKQRVMGLCLGYEDLNDHDELCRDRMMALLCESDDVNGERRHKESDRGKALAGKSTLNRLELRPVEDTPRYQEPCRAAATGAIGEKRRAMWPRLRRHRRPPGHRFRTTGGRPLWRLCCKSDVGVSQIRTTTVLASCLCAGQTVL